MGKVFILLIVGGVAGFFVGWAVAAFAPNLSAPTLQSIGAVVGAIIGGQAGYRWRDRSRHGGRS